MRIWWQSMSNAERSKGYWPMLRKQLAEAAEPGTEVDVNGTRVGIIDQHRYFEALDVVSVLSNAVTAEKRGYDVFCVANFLDPGLRDARAMVDIPVLGLGETSMLTSLMMGANFSLVLVNEFFEGRVLENVHRYGLDKRFVGCDYIPFDPHAIDRAFLDPAERDRCLATFVEGARKTIANGAEVIIPAGGRLIAFLNWAGLRSVDGVPILDGVTVLLKMAENAVRLKQLTGVFTSRRRLYARPPANLIDQARPAYREAYGIPDL